MAERDPELQKALERYERERMILWEAYTAVHDPAYARYKEIDTPAYTAFVEAHTVLLNELEQARAAARERAAAVLSSE